APRRPAVEPWRAPEEPGAPTMIPDRTPSPPSGDNRTFDAFGADAELAGLEARAVAAVRPPKPAEVEPASTPLSGVLSDGTMAGESMDFDPPRRRRWWIAAVAVGALAGGGWWLATDHNLTPVEPEPVVTPVEPPEPPTVVEPAPAEPPLVPALDPPVEPAPAEPAVEPATPEVHPATPEGRRPPVEPVRTTPVRNPTPPPPAPEVSPAPAPEVRPAPAPAPTAAQPGLVHTPVASVSLGATAEFQASIAHGRYNVTFYYRPASSSAPYRSKPMIQKGSVFATTLTVDDSFAAGIEYHIRAMPDEPGLQALSSGSGFQPHRVAVH
ncbi:MAG: hypothetical protein ABIO70_11355, partial [Pseudomonadota bacterium]